MDKLSELERIARDYHTGSASPDMYIEGLAQEYDLSLVCELIPTGASVLEMGFGDGVTFSKLSTRGAYSVVEAVPLLCENARLLGENLGVDARIYCSLFEEFEPPELYDFVFASHVLEHVEAPVQLLGKIRSWLKPDGKLIVIVPNAESLHRILAVHRGLIESVHELSERDAMVGHLRVYSLDDLREHLQIAEFELLEVFGSFLKPLPNSMLLGLGPNNIEKLCSVSSSLPPEILANLIVVAGRESSVGTNREIWGQV